MIKTICYIHNTPALKSWNKRHGYDELRKKGYKIMVIDISPIVNIIAFESVKRDLLNDKNIDLIVCHNKLQFFETIKSLDPTTTMAIPYFDFKLDYYFVYKCLSDLNIPYSLLHRVNSEAKMPSMSTNRILSYLKTISLKNIINSILIRIPKKLIPLRKAKYFFIGGRENITYYTSNNLIDSHTELVNAHALNYEECITLKEDLKLNKKYVVFLDQYMPYHPDHIELGIYIDPEKYYSELENLMRLIEEEFGFEIIIAEHPKADYNQTKYFLKYKKIKFHSVELVKNSEFVIGNFSTALSFCPFFQKKVLICNSDCFKSYDYFTRRVIYWQNELGVNSLNLSNNINKEILLNYIKKPIDLVKYKTCIQNTMKADFDWNSSKQSFWEIFNKIMKTF